MIFCTGRTKPETSEKDATYETVMTIQRRMKGSDTTWTSAIRASRRLFARLRGAVSALYLPVSLPPERRWGGSGPQSVGSLSATLSTSPFVSWSSFAASRISLSTSDNSFIPRSFSISETSLRKAISAIRDCFIDYCLLRYAACRVSSKDIIKFSQMIKSTELPLQVAKRY